MCCVILVVNVSTHAYAQNNDVTSYCMKKELEGFTGKDTPPVQLGTFSMSVDVAEKNDQFFISFENHMPDSGQILEAGDIPARKGSNGDLEFDFNDNWGNEGKGQLHQDGESATITLKQVKATSDPWGRNAGRQYGTYTLTKNCMMDNQ
jgi:hypothetical protein